MKRSRGEHPTDTQTSADASGTKKGTTIFPSLDAAIVALSDSDGPVNDNEDDKLSGELKTGWDRAAIFPRKKRRAALRLDRPKMSQAAGQLATPAGPE